MRESVVLVCDVLCKDNAARPTSLEAERRSAIDERRNRVTHVRLLGFSPLAAPRSPPGP